ncbi:MAG: class I SAM-dependent methyltransferase [Elusimicrobiota bacterium]
MERKNKKSKKVDKRDFNSASTLQSTKQLKRFLSKLRKNRKPLQTMIDVGCGYGGLTNYISDYLGVAKTYGIDLDKEKIKVAETREIKTEQVNVESEKFPFKDNSVDLVTTFGVFEHLRYYDNLMEESNRVLKKDGYLLCSFPNLGSWIRRVSLLLGRQPRDIEISTKKPFGTLGIYDDKFLNHVHTPTYRAFKEMLEYHEFVILKKGGIFPYQYSKKLKVIDKITAPIPSLCRRIIILAKKEKNYSKERENNDMIYDESVNWYFRRE